MTFPLAQPRGSRAHGLKSLKLSIGGMGLHLEWDRVLDVGRPHPCYEHFAGPGKDATRIRVHTQDMPERPLGRLLFDAWPNWRLYQRSPGYALECFDTGTNSRNMLAFLSPDLREVSAHVPREPAAWSLPRLMNPLGQLILAHRLPGLGGLLVHSLAVDDNGLGRVFVGPSGAGKSTMARFWRRRQGVRVLCDEHVVLRKEHESGRFDVYGTPWPGMTFSVAPGPVPLAQVFSIEHGPEHRVVGEPAGLLAGRLFSQVFLPRWSREIIETAARLVAELPLEAAASRLAFAKRPTVIDYVRSLPQGGETCPRKPT